MNCRIGETYYPGEKVKAYSVCLADTHIRHIQNVCKQKKITRARFIQLLLDAEIKREQIREEAENGSKSTGNH